MTSTTLARRAGGIVVGLLAVAMVPLTGTAIIKRNKELGLKLFEPYIAFTRLFAGRRFAPLAMLEHRGRKSGRVYTTPLSSVRYKDGYLLPVVYGDTVDWCRNVLADGHAILHRNGQAHRLERPEIISLDAAAAAGDLSALGRFTMREAQQGLWLHHATATTA